MSVGPRNRRKDVRRAFPQLFVQVGKIIYRTKDWSLGGMALCDALSLVEGAGTGIGCEVKGHFGLEEAHLPCPFRAVVIRADREAGLVAIRFLELRPDSFTFIERLLRRAQPVPPEPPPPEAAPPEPGAASPAAASPSPAGAAPRH